MHVPLGLAKLNMMQPATFHFLQFQTKLSSDYHGISFIPFTLIETS